MAAEPEFPVEDDDEDGRVERRIVSEPTDGPPDLMTNLGQLCDEWRDVQQARLAAEQRGLVGIAAALLKIEQQLARRITKTLRAHPVWPWLSQYPGLGGVQTARLLPRIRDPWRFPGQRCAAGHYMRPIYAVGERCPVVAVVASAESEKSSGRCDGTMLPPRPGTGTRSLWHLCGLHVVDGHSPRRAKGHRADWDPIARTCILQPGGIAEQIVRLRVPKYRDIYDAEKERLTNERGIEVGGASGPAGGPAFANNETEGVDIAGANGSPGGPLRPIQIECIARKIAAKAFLGDLLRAWKEADPLSP